MTALKLIPGGIADHATPAAIQALRHLYLIKQLPCPCRDKMCRAASMEAAGHPEYPSAGARCIDRIQARTGDIKKLECGTWAEKTSTGAWHPLPIVTVRGVDLDSGIIGDVRYTVRTVAGELDVRPIMEGVTEDDADTYLDAAVGLARFEMGLDCMDVEP